MALQTVTAKTIIKEGERKGEEVSGSIEYDFGNDLADATKKFGDDVVFSLFEQQAKIQCQARMRAELLSSTGSVTRVAEQWKPGVQMRASVDPISAAKNAVAGMDPEAKKEFLKKMKAELGL